MWESSVCGEGWFWAGVTGNVVQSFKEWHLKSGRPRSLACSSLTSLPPWAAEPTEARFLGHKTGMINQIYHSSQSKSGLIILFLKPTGGSSTLPLHCLSKTWVLDLSYFDAPIHSTPPPFPCPSSDAWKAVTFGLHWCLSSSAQPLTLSPLWSDITSSVTTLFQIANCPSAYPSYPFPALLFPLSRASPCSILYNS